MSDTPRTETYVLNPLPQVVSAEWARQLERELNAANSRIELLMSANADVARIAGERDAAEKRVNRLEAVVNDPHALWANWLRGDVKLPAGIGDVRQYQDRIKRLEDCAETAWGIIANVDSGSWQEQRADWREAATRWRDKQFHPELSERKAKEAKP